MRSSPERKERAAGWRRSCLVVRNDFFADLRASRIRRSPARIWRSPNAGFGRFVECGQVQSVAPSKFRPRSHGRTGGRCFRSPCRLSWRGLWTERWTVNKRAGLDGGGLQRDSNGMRGRLRAFPRFAGRQWRFDLRVRVKSGSANRSSRTGARPKRSIRLPRAIAAASARLGGGRPGRANMARVCAGWARGRVRGASGLDDMASAIRCHLRSRV